MKKIFALLCLIFVSTAFIYCQDIKYEYSVTYNRSSSGITADITITVTSGSPEFTFYLTTNHPYKSEVLQKSGPAKRKTCTFKDVKPGSYFIKVEDKSGEQTGRTLIISENQEN
jgi:hypothetical protein